MDVKLFINDNINGKIVEKRLMEVVTDLGIEAHVEILHNHSSDVDGIFYTPTLIVNNQVISSGKVLSKEEMSSFFVNPVTFIR
ncbi:MULTISPECIES: thioredoxin family protein [Bacillaceae]|uniref:Thioredoxin family protein n=1 Tax=Evansella alkalicola TaxID=745819 RepID=A0ABS6JUU7_9BACI|nr:MULTISPECIES: thioredoxin family protein [Bacillaceae]MBU9721876.1 thioredoxin family protein [Bacillus alkalicola]